MLGAGTGYGAQGGAGRERAEDGCVKSVGVLGTGAALTVGILAPGDEGRRGSPQNRGGQALGWPICAQADIFSEWLMDVTLTCLGPDCER